MVISAPRAVPVHLTLVVSRDCSKCPRTDVKESYRDDQQTEELACRSEAVSHAGEHSVILVGNPDHWTECALLEEGIHLLPSVSTPTYCQKETLKLIYTGFFTNKTSHKALLHRTLPPWACGSLQLRLLSLGSRPPGTPSSLVATSGS